MTADDSEKISFLGAIFFLFLFNFLLSHNHFKTIILKFKTFIYNSDSKIIYNFCMYGGNTLPVGEEVIPSGEKFFTDGIFRKNTSKYAKLMVEAYISDNYRP